MKSKEAQLQAACVEWFRYQYPQFKYNFFAIPNGGSRNKIEAANLKRQGVVAGVADMFLAVANDNGNGLFIEFKYGKNIQTIFQKEFMMAIRNNGYGYNYRIIYSFDEFKTLITEYLK